MVDFNKLRERKGSNFESLQKKLEQTGQTGGHKKDDRIWKPKANKDNKSSNIIRFLPIPFVDLQSCEEGKISEVDLTPMAKILRHSFQGKNGWYIENSLQTFGEECPVREHDRQLWGPAKKNNDEALQKILKKRIPKTDFYANVLIIKDGTNPENNGKVMLYQFGETVRKLIEKCDKPEFDTDPKFDPFDMWEGANLMLNLVYEKKKIGDKEANVPSFDNVKWDRQSALADGDESEMERIWKEEHSIAEFYDRKNYKSFDDLKAKFEKVMGINSDSSKPSSSSAEDMLDKMTNSGNAASAKAADEPSLPEPSMDSSLDDDDDLAEFQRLIDGD